jgi:DNA-binding phage protein
MPQLKDKKRPTKRAKSREIVFSKQEKRFLREVGKRILTKAHERNRSLESIAFKMGISRSGIYRIINGESDFKILTLVTIAKGLGFKELNDLLPKLD